MSILLPENLTIRREAALHGAGPAAFSATIQPRRTSQRRHVARQPGRTVQPRRVAMQPRVTPCALGSAVVP